MLLFVFIIVFLFWRVTWKEKYLNKSNSQTKALDADVLEWVSWAMVIIVYVILIICVSSYDEWESGIETHEAIAMKLSEELSETSDPQTRQLIENQISSNERILNSYPNLSEERIKFYKFLLYFG